VADNQLHIPDQFFRYFDLFPDLRLRVKNSIEMLQLPTDYEQVHNWIERLHAACDMVRNSEGLRQAFAATLTVGNVINDGKSQGGAFGIALLSLVKLCQQASYDQKSGLLNFTYMLLKEFYPDSLGFHTSGIGHTIERAHRVDLVATTKACQQCLDNVNNIRESLTKVEVIEGVTGTSLKDFYHSRASSFVEEWGSQVQMLHSRLEEATKKINQMSVFMHWEKESEDMFKALHDFTIYYAGSYDTIQKKEELAVKSAARARDRANKEAVKRKTKAKLGWKVVRDHEFSTPRSRSNGECDNVFDDIFKSTDEGGNTFK